MAQLALRSAWLWQFSEEPMDQYSFRSPSAPGSVYLLQQGFLHEYQTDYFKGQGQGPSPMETDSVNLTQGIVEFFTIS